MNRYIIAIYASLLSVEMLWTLFIMYTAWELSPVLDAETIERKVWSRSGNHLGMRGSSKEAKLYLILSAVFIVSTALYVL